MEDGRAFPLGQLVLDDAGGVGTSLAAAVGASDSATSAKHSTAKATRTTHWYTGRFCAPKLTVWPVEEGMLGAGAEGGAG